MLTVIAFLAIGQTLPTAKPSPPIARATYSVQRAASIAQGKPLVVFLRCKARIVEGCVSVSVDRLDGYPDTPSIVVGVPHSTLGQAYAGTLSTTATDTQIRQVAGLEVRRLAFPFFRRSAQRIADDKPHARQLPTWFPREAVRYAHANYTQSIYTLNNGPAIDKVDRGTLEAKWQVPGGLEFAEGWKSDLFANIPPPYEPVKKLLPVVNSFGHVQYELGWYREYPIGTWFADVLSTDGNVFEVRVREKQSGGWQSYIAYKSPRHRPAGYVPVRSAQCAECHDRAGTGGYAVGMVPGSDGVISFPFEALE